MFAVKFDTDNAAFRDVELEAARILEELAAKVRAGRTAGPIADANGNTVGSWTLEHAPHDKGETDQ